MIDAKAAIVSLIRICGEANLITAEADTERHRVDWLGQRRGSPLAVVFPQNTQQVSDLLRYCNEHRIGIIPQGGNTSYSAGAVADASGSQVIIAMEKMNRIRSIDPRARTMTAEAGCILETLHHAVEAQGLYFPLRLGSKGSCQIGGNLATNAGGLNVIRYGNTRDLCLGIEAVLPSGEVIHGLSGLHKNNAGYDLRHLLIGSEGTLGVITAATLKLTALPQPALTAWIAVSSVEVALMLLDHCATQLPDSIGTFEIVPRTALELAHRYQPHLVRPFGDDLPPLGLLVEIAHSQITPEDAQAVLFEVHDRLDDIIIAMNEEQRNQFWALRESIPLANQKHGKWIRADIALPHSTLPDFIRDCARELQAAGPMLLQLENGHLGDGNLHVNIRPRDEDPAQNPELSRQIADIVYQCVQKHGGTFSAEHGIGQAKVDLLKKYGDAASIEAMRAIKNALDPNGIMNPDVLFA